MKKYSIKNILGLGALFAGTASLTAGTVSIKWQDTDKYSDVGSYYGSDDKLESFKEEIESYVERVAKNELPDGAELSLTVTNVDLAGEFEPWRVNEDVRIVRDIYPPKMKFSYTLREDGEVVRDGKENLSDLDFNYNIGRRFFDQDQFFYEKEMLADWIRYELDS